MEKGSLGFEKVRVLLIMEKGSPGFEEVRGLLTIGPPIKAAAIPLIRANIEAVPIPTFLTSVGNSSELYR